VLESSSPRINESLKDSPKEKKMKHRIALSFVLNLIMLLLVLSAGSAAKAQQEGKRLIADTGVITLGPNQVLRLSAQTGDGQILGNLLYIRFRQVGYSQGACIGTVCKHVIASQSISPPIALGPGEAASIDITNSAFGVRGMVLSNSQDVRVTATVVDTETGKIVAIWVPQGSPAVGKD
jgi:hypothetical protein